MVLVVGPVESGDKDSMASSIHPKYTYSLESLSVVFLFAYPSVDPGNFFENFAAEGAASFKNLESQYVTLICHDFTQAE